MKEKEDKNTVNETTKQVTIQVNNTYVNEINSNSTVINNEIKK